MTYEYETRGCREPQDLILWHQELGPEWRLAFLLPASEAEIARLGYRHVAIFERASA